MNEGERDIEGGAQPQPLDSARRRLVLGGAGYAALAGSGLGLAGCGGGGGAEIAQAEKERFGFGVASGDPLADRVILWTRVNLPDPAPTDVQWDVATDVNFSNIVRTGSAATNDAQDYTVKVDATGLQAGTHYWYRFRHSGRTSVTGHTKTLPTGSVSQVKMAVFSCAAYPLGQFHAYADAARRLEIDVALHLGDYIYETGLSNAEQTAAGVLGRKVDPQGELVSLIDYRRRYALYRTDSDLRAVHATMPMIAVWDDHEFINEIWRDGASGHDPATEGSFAARRAAAVQAYHEWMPTRPPEPANLFKINRRFDFGNLMTLHMLDTRVIGRDAPLTRDGYLLGQAADPARQLLGQAQSDWLTAGLQASTATWQVLGQQVVMGKMKIPQSVYDSFSEDTLNEYLGALEKPAASRTAREQLLVAQPMIPYELNNWNGFEAAREKVLSTAKTLDKNLVVLSGDSHNAWANNLTDATGTSVGAEFAVTSVTSRGLEQAHTNVNKAFIGDAFLRMMPDVKYAQTSDRGYSIVTVSPGETRCEYLFVSSVLDNNFTVSLGQTMRTVPGAANRKVVVA
ncbi:MAG: alkaline phosphatase D family protein [Burkholderiales bacterium]|nr:alkaline phosphatase D family protein [Burkholderiales bacterium]